MNKVQKKRKLELYHNDITLILSQPNPLIETLY